MHLLFYKEKQWHQEKGALQKHWGIYFPSCLRFSCLKCLDFPDQSEASAGQKNQDVENNGLAGFTRHADRRGGRQVGHKHTALHAPDELTWTLIWSWEKKKSFEAQFILQHNKIKIFLPETSDALLTALPERLSPICRCFFYIQTFGLNSDLVLQ